MLTNNIHMISTGFLLVINFLSLGYAVDPTKKSTHVFDEGLRELVQEIHRNESDTDSSYSQDARQVNGSLFHHFPCERLPPSPKKPTSVHHLRPGDIDVVAAMGDSYTAAKAAGGQGLNSLLHDYRGLSWSAGGDGAFSTLHSLPNILREYNPDLYGFSNSIGTYMDEESGFNVAISGATSNDLAFQAALLIQKLKNDPLVDIENDWKLITLLIGGNDICRSCHSFYNASIYQRHLKSALDMIKLSLPRTFVNLVELMPVELARYLPKGILCERLQDYYCQCVVYPKSEVDYDQLTEKRKEFQQVTENLISSGVYDTSEDFTVVLQPFYRNATIPTKPGSQDIDYSLFAVDCFHYSAKGQSSAGLALWNNMLQPLHHKDTDWSPGEKMLCPSNFYPYLATRHNSKLLNKGLDLKSYSWQHDETAVEQKRENDASIRDNPNNSDMKLVKNNKSHEKEVENLKQGLTVMVIGTIAMILLMILAGVLYYGMGLIRQMGILCHVNRSVYQKI